MRIFVHDYAGHPFALELSRELARRGHTVRHAYFAADIGPKGRTERLDEDGEHFSVEPIAIRQSYSKADLVRRHFLDGLYGVAAGQAIARFQPDVVLAANTPLNALNGLQRASRRGGARFVLWLQDVFGLAAGTLVRDRWAGAGWLAALHYEALERGVLRRSDHVVVITPDFLPYVTGAGAAAERVTVIPNWGPLSLVEPRPKVNPWSVRHGTADKRVLAYTGTLGLKHNPQMLHALAQAFHGRDDVVVQAACGGLGAAWLRDHLRAHPTPNLQLLPVAAVNDFSDALGGADVLVGLLERQAGAFSAPSKVLAYLCAGRPVLLSAPESNSSARTLADAGGGVVTPAGDAAAFVQAGRALIAEADRRAALGAAGYAYANRTFNIRQIADRFEPCLGSGGAAASALSPPSSIGEPLLRAG
jgi:colanic acid biosynthesis glycosyl transferase WcaI